MPLPPSLSPFYNIYSFSTRTSFAHPPPPFFCSAASTRYTNSDNAKQEHSPLGKVGAAVLGNVEAHKFQLYLYYNKKQQVCSINISPKFNFIVRYALTSRCLGRVLLRLVLLTSACSCLPTMTRV